MADTGHWHEDHWHEWHWHEWHWIRVPITVVDVTEDLFRKVGIQTQWQRVFDVSDVNAQVGIGLEVRQVLDIADGVQVESELKTELSFMFERSKVLLKVER